MKSKTAVLVAAIAASVLLSFGAAAENAADDIINGAEDVVDGVGDAAGDIVDGVGDAVGDIVGDGSNDDPDGANEDDVDDDSLVDDTDEEDIDDALDDDPEDDEYDDDVDDAELADDANPATSSTLFTATMIAASAAGVAYLTRKRLGNSDEHERSITD